MSVQQRRERDRTERHRLIIDAARELAEAEGWDAVTTRRLAERVGYSQPVLYSHFQGKEAIVRAVAIQGFAELAEVMRVARTARTARTTQRATERALRALAVAYVDFATARPALYKAMFASEIDLAFGTDDAPAELRDAFGEILAAVEPLAANQNPETLTEVVWSTLHGLVTLAHGRRVRPNQHNARLDLLLSRF